MKNAYHDSPEMLQLVNEAYAENPDNFGLSEKMERFVIAWSFKEGDDVDFDADIHAGSIGQAYHQFREVFPEDHVVRIRRASAIVH